MKLVDQEQVEVLDPAFGRMATQMGQHAWSLPQLTMREKTFVFLAADLCTVNVGFPLVTHVKMAGVNGVSLPECIAAIRHLAPYVGYPTAAVALQQLRSQESAEAAEPRSVAGHLLPQEVFDALAGLDADFAVFFADQFNQRWSNDDLSPRERALACLAADVVNQTLDESMAFHADLAVAEGAGPEQISAVLLLVAEYGMAKTWRAYRMLRDR